MYFKYKVVHSVPGRLRLHIPILKQMDEYSSIEELFQSIKGVRYVRIEPIIQTMLIEYDEQEIEKQVVLRNVGLFFNQISEDMGFVMDHSGNLRGDLVKSFVSGVLLLIAFMRKNGSMRPDVFDYLVVISTSYTVLSHGENRLGHPDVLTGIISMVSLGAQNILKVSLVTWLVNLIEVISDIMKENNRPLVV